MDSIRTIRTITHISTNVNGNKTKRINKKDFEKFRVKQPPLERNHLIRQGNTLCALTT